MADETFKKSTTKRETPRHWRVEWYNYHDYAELLEQQDVTLGKCSSASMAAEVAVEKWFEQGTIEIDDTETSVYCLVKDLDQDPDGPGVRVEVVAEQVWKFSSREFS